jgi:transposase-like protein
MKSALSADHLQHEDAAFAYVEAKLWPTGPICSHCGETNRLGKLKGKATRPGLYKCYACKKQFTVRMGTIFESSHVPLHVWLQVIYLMNSSKKGFATRQIQRTLECSMKTAWFLGHRVRECMKAPGWNFTEPMGGAGHTVEGDETWIGGKAANRAFAPIPEKQAVVSLVQRNGGVRSFHVPRVTAANLAPIVARHIHADSRFITDESNVYAPTAKWFADYQSPSEKFMRFCKAFGASAEWTRGEGTPARSG